MRKRFCAGACPDAHSRCGGGLGQEPVAIRRPLHARTHSRRLPAYQAHLSWGHHAWRCCWKGGGIQRFCIQAWCTSGGATRLAVVLRHGGLGIAPCRCGAGASFYGIGRSGDARDDGLFRHDRDRRAESGANRRCVGGSRSRRFGRRADCEDSRLSSGWHCRLAREGPPRR